MNNRTQRELVEVKLVYRQYATVSSDGEDVESEGSQFMTLFDAKCGVIALTGIDESDLTLRLIKEQVCIMRRKDQRKQCHVSDRFHGINLIEFYQLYQHFHQNHHLKPSSHFSGLFAQSDDGSSAYESTLFDPEILYAQLDPRGKGWVTKDRLLEVKDRVLECFSPLTVITFICL
jgi:hypothetical protein